MKEKKVFTAYQMIRAFDNKKTTDNQHKSEPSGRLINIPSFYTDNDCYAYFNGKDFKTIFGDKRANLKKYRSRLPIVKITRPETGLTIYREYRSYYVDKQEQYVGLTYYSLLNLSNDEDDYKSIDKLEITEASLFSWMPYYWHHPYHATRISMRIGFVSLVTSIVSVILSIIL